MTLFNWAILLLGVSVGILIDSIWTFIMLKRFTKTFDMMMEIKKEALDE